MNEETALTIPTENVFLFARNRTEMQESNLALATWLRRKIESEQRNLDELEKAVTQAKKNKWAIKPLQAQVSRARRLVIYYDKLQKAVSSGFTLIPLPWNVETFAIRVKRQNATPAASGSWYEHNASIPEQKTDKPPAGEGRYVSPISVGYVDKTEREKEKGKMAPYYVGQAYDFTEVAFPVLAAKPELMSAAANSMALRIFDELGIAPSQRGRDPLLIGLIKGPNYREQAFLIAWYLDTRSL